MARAFYGSLVTDIIGSIGGLTFQTSNKSKIIRHRPYGITTATDLQQSQQALFSEAVAAWNAIDVDTKNLWNAFALAHPRTDYYGTTTTLSGYNYFISLYVSAVLLGNSPLTSPPTYGLVTMPPAPTITFQSSTVSLILEWSPEYEHTGVTLLLFCTPIQLSANYANRSALVFIDVIAGDSTDTVNIWNEYTNTLYGDSSLSCTNTFIGGIKFMIVAINRATYLSSPGTLVWAQHQPV
jgi:hypothetical protein